jgi:hypothetical protein
MSVNLEIEAGALANALDQPIDRVRRKWSAALGGHWRARWMLGRHLVITVWFPYRRRLLLVVLNPSCAIAVGAFLVVIDPAAAVTMRADLHC